MTDRFDSSDSSRDEAPFLRIALALLIGIVTTVVGTAHAQGIDGPLQRKHVREYIRLRIKTHQLQERMKAHADQYDNVIQAFYERRAQLLQKEDWSPEAFDALRKRIMRTEVALDMAADSAKRRAQRREEMQSIASSSHLSEKQKTQMRKQLARQDSLRWARHIEPTRRDWPAIRPYLDALEHLTDYVAGNRPDPPSIDDLPPASQ